MINPYPPDDTNICFANTNNKMLEIIVLTANNQLQIESVTLVECSWNVKPNSMDSTCAVAADLKPLMWALS